MIIVELLEDKYKGDKIIIMEKLTKLGVNVFVENVVGLLFSNIKMGKKDKIHVHKKTEDSKGKSIFSHFINVCPIEQLCQTEYWHNSEIFGYKDSDLFLYLKGRLLIQQTTTWTIYSGDPLVKHYECLCNYSLK